MSFTTEKLSTEFAIKSLLTRERYYRDTCRWENLRASYHPDASKTNINISWFTGDIDGFVAGSRGMAQGGTNALHTICPVEVHVNGKKAVSESTGSITIRFEHNGQEFDCVSLTRFISRLECVDGEWKLLTLEAIYDRDYISPTTPFAVSEPILPKGGRKSYKCIAWVLAQKGFAIKQDLAGVDDPASAEALMKQAFDWLFEEDKRN
ncbi:hypothetical protein BGZ63DRAFT_454925 [Mariannaea sp. PMI_226]|nr:hypothetical protein BGZ63DRAFT_454925 [Mariannaea sp. PMI_226]